MPGVLSFPKTTEGNAQDCGQATDDAGNTWISVAHNYGFILVCAEATMYNMTANNKPIEGGVWDVPEVQNSTTGTRCEDSDSVDVRYIKAVMEAMEGCGSVFDISNVFNHGCSGGSSAGTYLTDCMHKFWPDRVHAWATHSTGLKIKGDNIWLGSTLYGTWAECDHGCEFFPIMVDYNPNLKVCVYDNYDDPTLGDPYYYETSKQLADKWRAAGNPAEESYGYGGHCATHSRPAIARCLDDGQGRLITRDLGLLKEVSTTTSTSTTSTTTKGCTNIPPDVTYFDADSKCQSYSDQNKCGYAYMEGWCCNTCHGCDPACETYFDPTTTTTTTINGGGQQEEPTPEVDVCTNLPPDDPGTYADADYKCGQYQASGKCGNTWMTGYCCETCHFCQPSCITYFDTTTTTTTTTTMAGPPVTDAPPVCADRSSGGSGGGTTTASSGSGSSGSSSSGSGSTGGGSNSGNSGGVVNVGTACTSVMCQWWPYFLIFLSVASVVAVVVVGVVYRVPNPAAAPRSRTSKPLAKTIPTRMSVSI
jgi:hypothetical protein